MVVQRKKKVKAKYRIAEERARLLQAVNLAKKQWQYAGRNEDNNSRKYDIMDLLERRYMYLLKMAKDRKLHVLKHSQI